MFDELITSVHLLRQQKDMALADIDKEIRALTEQRNIMAQPYDESEKELLSRWEKQILEYAKPYENELGKVTYRGGYSRVSYNNDVVETVTALLKDTLPEVGAKLEKARKETAVKPSWGIEIKS